MLYFENAQNFNDIFSVGYILILVALSVSELVFALFLSRKFVQSAQQSGYVCSEYSRWLSRRGNIHITRLFMLALLSVLSYFALSVALSFSGSVIMIFVPLIPHALFVVLYVLSDRKRKEKKPLVLTKRAKRLYITFSLLFVIFAFAVLLGCNVLGFLMRSVAIISRIRFILSCFTPLLIPVVVLLAAAINAPIERAINKGYIDRCKKKIAENEGVIRIGITGSYGKTGVKEILKTILSEKYKVLSTPLSYNTPMGICKTVEELDGSFDVFIAEMGARHVGDVKELCDIVRPSYAVINGIIGHHLETFGTLENVKKAKAELIEGVGDGTIVLTCDNPTALSLAKENEGKDIVLAGVDTSASPDVFATDIRLSKDGSAFRLNVFGDEVEISTALLGKHNVSNICLAAALCFKLGLSVPEISAGISRVRPFEHRLQVIKGENGVTVIDDSYNANSSGVVAALETLSLFEGRKIVVTPGIVELGKEERKENELLAKNLVSTADFTILVGAYNSYIIRDAMIKEGYSFDNIFVANDLEEAKQKLKEIAKEGDVVLFENDLPDKFD